MPDVIFINPSDQKDAYQSLSSNLTAKEPPLWAGLLANAVRKKGFSVSIIDAVALNLDHDEIIFDIKNQGALLVCLVVYGHNPSASTQTMPAAISLASKLNEMENKPFLTALGGHISALPVRSLNELQVDFICRGEGLYSLLAFLEQKKRQTSVVLEEIPGIIFLKNKVPVQTSQAPLIEDLDTQLPGVAWDLLPMESYRAHNWHSFGYDSREKYASLYTTLGCPFSCDFCCIHAPFKESEGKNKKSYRYWSSSFILDQIDFLVNRYGIEHLKIADEMFVLNRRHVEEICSGIIERGYHLNIWAYSRVDTINEATAKLLKKAGFNWICLGIESSVELSLAGVSKKTNLKVINEAVRILKKNNINLIANFIFGLPQDNLSTMKETLSYAESIDPEYANFYSAMAYPGSKLYEQKENHQVEDWREYSQLGYRSKPLGTNSLTPENVLEFRDKAFDSFFKSKTFLDNLECKFGKKVRNDILSLVQTKLDRKILLT